MEHCKEILWALKDCAIFPLLGEKNENHKQWHSLIRDDNAERMLREAQFVLKGIDVQNYYQFVYNFRPKYSDEATLIKFDFTKDGYFPKRIYGLIGKNGVGKTQLISSLPLHLSEKDKVFFGGDVPIFSKIIAISNSYYDNFKIPDAAADFNYVYCGLSQRKNDESKTSMKLDEMISRILEAAKNIVKKNRVDDLLEVLNIVFTDRQLHDIILEEENGRRTFDDSKISALCQQLSSGENSLLYIFFILLANIRLDSLLLFDEPETHLHPNAITQLMTAFYKLLEKYDSYAIITTHSPLIVREIKSDCVYVMEKEDNECIIRKIGIESLGANPSTLIDEIFDNKGIQKHYKKAIKRMKDEGQSYEKIIEALQTDGIPLGLSLSFYVRNLFKSEK